MKRGVNKCQGTKKKANEELMATVCDRREGTKVRINGNYTLLHREYCKLYSKELN